MKKHLSRSFALLFCFVLALNIYSPALAEIPDATFREMIRYWMGIEIPEEIPCVETHIMDENFVRTGEIKYYYELPDEKTGESHFLMIVPRDSYLSFSHPVPADEETSPIVDEETGRALVLQICERYHLFGNDGSLSYEELLEQRNAVMYPYPIIEPTKRLWRCVMDADAEGYGSADLMFDIQDMKVVYVFLRYEKFEIILEN